jgi:hypothetical protein
MNELLFVFSLTRIIIDKLGLMEVEKRRKNWK